jgi:hypothetical protein
MVNGGVILMALGSNNNQKNKAPSSLHFKINIPAFLLPYTSLR